MSVPRVRVLLASPLASVVVDAADKEPFPSLTIHVTGAPDISLPLESSSTATNETVIVVPATAVWLLPLLTRMLDAGPVTLALTIAAMQIMMAEFTIEGVKLRMIVILSNYVCCGYL